MELAIRRIQDITTLEIKGRLDATAAATAEKRINEILDDDAEKLLIDFSDTEFLGSSALRVLLAANKRLKRTGGEIRLSGLSRKLREVFDISGFAALFQMFDSKNEALLNF